MKTISVIFIITMLQMMSFPSAAWIHMKSKEWILKRLWKPVSPSRYWDRYYRQYDRGKIPRYTRMIYPLILVFMPLAKADLHRMQLVSTIPFGALLVVLYGWLFIYLKGTLTMYRLGTLYSKLNSMRKDISVREKMCNFVSLKNNFTYRIIRISVFPWIYFLCGAMVLSIAHLPGFSVLWSLSTALLMIALTIKALRTPPDAIHREIALANDRLYKSIDELARKIRSDMLNPPDGHMPSPILSNRTDD
jgi:hypothetical protein